MDTENTSYWEERYAAGRTGWDIGYASPPLTEYLGQLEDKELRILIPGAGNAYEAEAAWKMGFRNVFVLDVARAPLDDLQRRLPEFPADQLLQDDFFTHQGTYDLILEQTFFCSFPPSPENRSAYARQMHRLLRPGGKLVGLWFDIPLTGDPEKRPFGGDRAAYLSYLEPYFKVITFTTATNSIPPRAGNELFGIFQRA